MDPMRMPGREVVVDRGLDQLPPMRIALGGVLVAKPPATSRRAQESIGAEIVNAAAQAHGALTTRTSVATTAES